MKRHKQLQAKSKLQRTRIRRRRAKVRQGRLRGAALTELRRECFEMAHRAVDVDEAVFWLGYTCDLCDAEITWETFEMDHIIPRTRGGKDELANVRALCHQCHYERHNGKKPCPAKREGR